MKKLLVLFMVCTFLFAAVSFSDAMMCDKGMGKGMGMDGGHRMFEKLKSLGLDEKQMAEVEAIHFGAMKEMIKKRADMQVASVELREILGQDHPDLKTAEAKIRQIETLRGDMQMIHIKAREEVKSKLTPEQKMKFEAMMPVMHGGMMGKMQCDCGMKAKMKGGKRGKDKMDCDCDFFSEGHDEEMPMTGHQHMHHAK